MILAVLLLLLVASQIYWAVWGYSLMARSIPSRTVRGAAFAVLLASYYATLGYNADRLFQFPRFGPQPNPTHLGLADASLAVAQWWILTSTAALLLVIPVGAIQVAVRAFVRARRKSRRAVTASPPVGGDPPLSPQRRHFLEQAAGAVVGVPFVIGAYGFLYGRLNLEIMRHRVRLPRLPKEFAGFRLVQISDLHISAFMSEQQIRKYAGVANGLGADLMVLTGDFVTWDPSAERAVVNALAGLRAPFGVFACLGNHEAWSRTKDSITLLLQQAEIRVLRDARAPIAHGGEAFNLIGIEPDYGWSSHQVPLGLTAPERVNILLSHYPTVFDYAAELGIDLTLAGHTHGRQVKLDFISPNLAPRLLRTPYLAGWFRKPGGQLYVNRGIGTIGVPMRAGVPPEITVFELTPS
ncbi:MAG TPA: metallophosphoesterase [Bryobacteraceae bacterium]|nr:metallophosphoesterase [Bryobacteraceae bacterium]